MVSAMSDLDELVENDPLAAAKDPGLAERPELVERLAGDAELTKPE